jgi:replicative DNA helicase
MDIDKLPPHDNDLERDILGAILLERDAINEVNFIEPKDFYSGKNQTVFEAIRELDEKGEPIDIVTVTQHLVKSGKINQLGGPVYVSQLTNSVASSANIEYHARILSQMSMQRDFISTGRALIERGFSDQTDVFELSDWAEKKMFSIVETRTQGNARKLDDTIEQLTEKVKTVSENEGNISGVPSMIDCIDNITGGFQPSDLIILAARPGMGKTSLAVQLGVNAAKQGYKTLIFSLEMSSTQLSARIVSGESGISSSKMLKHGLEEHEFHQYYNHLNTLNGLPISIDDTPGVTINQIKSISRVTKKREGLDFVIIDYIQLIESHGNSNRNDQVSHISRQLKLIAKELDVPVIALSQLSRAVETRGGDKRPQLSDLRESGSIEQDADSVLFLYRPDYYGINIDNGGENVSPDYTELIFAKHRSGALDTAKLSFEARLTKFSEFEYKNGEGFSDQFPGNIKPNTAF